MLGGARFKAGAAALVAALLFACANTDGKREFVASLDEGQLAEYRGISRGRLATAALSAAGGAAVAMWWGSVGGEPLAGSLLGGVAAYAAYRAWPRKSWMLDHLHDNRQAGLWLRMYRGIVWSSHAAMLMWIIGYWLMIGGKRPEDARAA